MNILQVVPYFYPAWAYGGPAKLVYDTSTQLAARGHTVFVYTSDAYSSDQRMPPSKRVVSHPNFQVHYFSNLSNSLAFHANAYFPLRLFLMVPWTIRHFDVIHLHDFYTLANVWIGMWAEFYHIPYVISVHGCLESTRRLQRSRAKSLFLQLWGLHLLSRAARLIATSTNEQSDLRKLGIPKQNVIMQQHGVVLEEFQTELTRDRCRAEFGLPRTSLVLLFIGRLHPIKGLDLLLAALAHDELTSVTMVIAGTDEGIQRDLEQQAQALGLAKRVRFFGPIAGSKKARLFHAADAFVYPSRSEGFSVGILEAAAAGLPLLLTKGCHFPEVSIVKAGLIAPVSVSGISKMLRTFSAQSVASRRAMGKSAARLCQSTYSASTVLSRLEKIYQDVSSSTH